MLVLLGPILDDNKLKSKEWGFPGGWEEPEDNGSKVT